MRGVHHTGIIVSDLDRSIDFYHDVLGLEFATEPGPVVDDPELGPKLGVPGASLRMVAFKVGDGALELLEYLSPASPIDTPMPQNALGSHHVGFRVDDIEATVRELRGKGVEFIGEVTPIDDGVLAGWRWVYFKDPDGITLELVEVAYTREEERQVNIARYLADRPSRPTQKTEA
jgi:catechol 2,3-dioxygenase-like lactoylglutathione lyase family enzyme